MTTAENIQPDSVEEIKVISTEMALTKDKILAQLDAARAKIVGMFDEHIVEGDVIEGDSNKPAPELVFEAKKNLAIAPATILTQESYEGAGAQLVEIKTVSKAIDNRRKELKKPLDEAVKLLQGIFTAPLGFLEEAEKVIKGSMGAYITEQDRKRQLEEANLQEKNRNAAEKLEQKAADAADAGRHERAEVLQGQASDIRMTATAAPTAAAPKAAGVSARYAYKIEVTDPMALYKAVIDGRAAKNLVMPNQTDLDKLAAALKENTDVPGCKVVKAPVISGRAKK